MGYLTTEDTCSIHVPQHFDFPKLGF
jgi:hypothetical protein